MADNKTITAWLVVDWQSGQHRTRQSKPKHSELGTNELLTKIEIEVSVPDVDVPTLAARIDVPEPRVYAATMEALSDEEMPNWSDAANDVIESEELAIEQAPDGELERLVDSMVTRTLMSAPGLPDPELVKEYIEGAVLEMREGE